jgi:tetratricopeptide (TPR) repeat protein
VSPKAHDRPTGRRAQELFEEVVELPPDARARVLEQARAEDAGLYAEVVELLAQLERARSDALLPRLPRAATGDSLAESHGGATPLRLARGTLVGRYIVLDLLGSGGMGTVYTAYDPQLDRRVALKLLHPGLTLLGGTEAQGLVEARAMARLSHPNVVTVHDVGEAEGRVFLAMERVDGTTLGAWLRERKRSWREVVEALVTAGRGLAAAHAAGLVHRDFKPSNVLVGRDGRVRVTDFGLAWFSPSGHAQPEGLLPVGTRTYAAPEQLAGRPVDARADIYSFCVVLWEALTGEPLLPGPRSRTGPGLSHLPMRLQRLLARGLQAEPSERPPSMEAVLVELERGLRRPGAAAALAALVLVVGVGTAGAYAMTHTEAALCPPSEEQLAGVWDGAQRERVTRALVATGVPYARDTASRLEQALEAYARSWAVAHHDACLATRKRGEQSEELLSLRMACLTRRRLELQSLVEVLTEADAAAAEKALDAAAALAPVQECANLEALRARVPPPPEQARAEVESARRTLARVEALGELGRVAQARPLAEAALTRARELGYKPLQAESLLAQGRLLVGASELKSAVPVLEEAVWQGQSCRDDWTALKAGVALAASHVELGEWRQLSLWSGYAKSLLERLGGDAELESSLLKSQSYQAFYEHQYSRAARLLEDAVARARQRFGSRHLFTYMLEVELQLVLIRAGTRPEVPARLEQFLARGEELLGPRHPSLGNILHQLAVLEADAGRLTQAGELMDRAMAILREAHGEDSPHVLNVLNNRGDILILQGRYAEGLRDLEKAQTLYSRTHGERHPYRVVLTGKVLSAMARLGRLEEAQRQVRQLRAQVEASEGPHSQHLENIFKFQAEVDTFAGRHGEALAARQRLLALLRARLPPDNLMVLLAQVQLAHSLRATARLAEALALYQTALARLEATLGTDNTVLAPVVDGLGEALLDLRRPADAQAPLERALRMREHSGHDPNEVARVRFLLARALFESTGDLPRALSLATQSRREHAAAPHPDPRALRRIDAWLARVAPTRR